MIGSQSAVILGRAELSEALRNLPGRVVQKIMDEWTLKQATRMARIAKMSAPRDRNPKRKKPPSARLWRAIKASKIRNPVRRFGMISRAIAYGAGERRSQRARRRLFYVPPKKPWKPRPSRSTKPKPYLNPPSPRARHFHLVVLGTVMRQTRSGASRGKMWGRTSDPQFWQKAKTVAMPLANGEVGQQLREAYQRGIDLEIKRLERKYR